MSIKMLKSPVEVLYKEELDALNKNDAGVKPSNIISYVYCKWKKS